jgi:protein arginine N-methyltransferase 3
MEGMDKQLEAEILAAKNEIVEDDSLDEGEEENWSDWEEEQNESYLSLFDDRKFTTPEACFDHDAKEYGFDIREWNNRFKLGFYGCVKLVNYIRSRRADRESAEEILSVFQGSEGEYQPWNEDRYLLPVIQEDNILTCLDFDGE